MVKQVVFFTLAASVTAALGAPVRIASRSWDIQERDQILAELDARNVDDYAPLFERGVGVESSSLFRRQAPGDGPPPPLPLPGFPSVRMPTPNVAPAQPGFYIPPQAYPPISYQSYGSPYRGAATVQDNPFAGATIRPPPGPPPDHYPPPPGPPPDHYPPPPGPPPGHYPPSPGPPSTQRLPPPLINQNTRPQVPGQSHEKAKPVVLSPPQREGTMSPPPQYAEVDEAPASGSLSGASPSTLTVPRTDSPAPAAAAADKVGRKSSFRAFFTGKRNGKRSLYDEDKLYARDLTFDDEELFGRDEFEEMEDLFAREYEFDELD